MSVDLIVLLFLILFSLYGLYRGFIISVINLIFISAYTFFSSQLFDLFIVKIDEFYEVESYRNNYIMKMMLIFIVGLILMFILDLIVKSFIKKGVIALFDRLGGLIIHFVIAYLIICVITLGVSIASPYLDTTFFDNSFFFSEDFAPYNIIESWWYNEPLVF